jgi:ABC-type Na+ efflux pump permease subunit
MLLLVHACVQHLTLPLLFLCTQFSSVLISFVLTPMPAAASGVAGQCVAFHSPKATQVLLSSPPKAPSTVFFGLISVNLVRPRFLPARQ